MKIIRLHIENFGRLSDFDMDFQDGINTVLQENGWGKSTLAAFIRVMFYGLEGGRKKDISENDRVKYSPWNKGPFGGCLEFEVQGKRYLVTRSFGQKDKDCTFKLQDAVTLLESKDYTERLGEEIFGIDRESFEKTSLIQHDAARYEGINSTIGSKVRSISQTDDLNNYDKAAEIMKNYLNVYTPRTKKGTLYKWNEEINELKAQATNQGVLEERIRGIRENRDREREKLESLKTERVGLQKELGQMTTVSEKAIHYKRLKDYEKAADQRRSAVKEREERFGERIPTREELQTLREKTEAAERQSVRVASFAQSTDSDRLERLKRYFRGGVPSQEEIVGQIKSCNEVQDLLRRRGDLEEEESREKQRLDEYDLELKRLEAAQALENAKKKKEKNKRRILSAVLLAMGVLLAIANAALHLHAIVWVVAALLVVASLVILFSDRVRSTAKEGSTPISEMQRIRQQEADGREKLARRREECTELERQAGALEAGIKAFLERMEISYSRADAEDVLYEMKNRAIEYLELCREREETQAQYDKLTKEARLCKEELGALLASMSVPRGNLDFAGIKSWIDETRQGLTTLERERLEEQKALKDLESFREAHKELSDPSDILSEEEIAQRKEELERRMDRLSAQETQIHEIISSYNRELEEAYDRAEDLAGKKESLEALKERFATEEQRYQLVKKTQEYLQGAKEVFTARFMSPIKNGFDKYYSLMTQGASDGSDFQIDANMNIFRKELGEFRDVETQSDGYADMIGLCIRMALLDVMYRDEKPLVIMDDPFSDLDQTHLDGAKQFLNTVSKDYQILYMTCHQVRKC